MLGYITSDSVEAFSQCPRKAFLLIAGEPPEEAHAYAMLIDTLAVSNKLSRRTALEMAGTLPPAIGPADLASGPNIVANNQLVAGDLQARCDYLTKVGETSQFGKFSYETVKVIGTLRASRQDILGLAYQAYVLGEIQGRLPSAGTLILHGHQSSKLKLINAYKDVRRIIAIIRSWSKAPKADAPAVVLNKHCQTCSFRGACLQRAEKGDNLSLLDRMTPKLMRKYHDKGVFTVTQLSHLYKARRSRKAGKRPVRHSLELQALAIRTGKTHVGQLPELQRKPVELILDFEGLPDRDTYYLGGILVCKGDLSEYESFWADDATAEGAMWSALAHRLEAFPEAPIYHYGSYEAKAFDTLTKRFGKGQGLKDRLVNVSLHVYGRVYFPVRSNGLKSLGGFLGAKWSDPQASGLMSLVWRHGWEATGDPGYKLSLLRYNFEDCEALRLVVLRLDEIGRKGATDPMIEMGNRSKRFATETGKTLHEHFARILKSAHLETQEHGVKSHSMGMEETLESPRPGGRKGHVVYQRLLASKVNRVVSVPPKSECSKGHGVLVFDDRSIAARTVTDIVFTRNGCRKTITRFEGKKGYCSRCRTHFDPPSLTQLQNRAFGHSFQAWAVYQRVVLRLPYRVIVQVTEHLFRVGLSASTCVNFLTYMAGYYAITEEAILQAILKSGSIHVDETKINIQGIDQYVWVFTDGRHIIFRLTETREPDIVREVLADYKGVLVSDFYAGYDSMTCRQQKCLIHLIRDINDNLWKAPFDKELELFALEMQSLLMPILEAVEKFGLKARNLRKFEKAVTQFYQHNITGREYLSEPVRTFQKRFDRYRDSLFTFLSLDGIPWENNMAERAIRQLAVQRKISGSFFQRSARDYLRLLAISQTCRFQGKSFLKFMLSKETNLDSFKRKRPIKYSFALPKRETESSLEEESAGHDPQQDAQNTSEPK